MTERSLESMKEELLALLLEEEMEPMEGLTLMDRSGKLLLSYSQQRMWFIDRFTDGSAAYNIAAAFEVHGRLQYALLELTLNEVVRRHEALRTTFDMNEGTPVQVIASHIHFEMPVTDLRALRPNERQAKLDWLVQEEALAPFDLQSGPLFRTRLIVLDEDIHAFLLTFHHIVFDGWSMGVMIREVAALYSAFVDETAPDLPELPVQYADFAHWQRERLAGGVLEQQIGYWRERLLGAPSLLSLPTSRPRPAVQAHEGDKVPVTVPLHVVQGLRQLSQQAQGTMFMTLLAAFSVLLSRYADQDDICIGTPVAHRQRAEFEPLLGFFTNTLVLRTRVVAEQSFVDLLAQVRAATLDAYAHQDVPFEKLLEHLAPDRNTSHGPLFQVMFALQNTPMGALDLPGLVLKPMNVETKVAKFDLTLTLNEAPDGLWGHLEYDTALFDRAFVIRMSDHFCRLLTEVAAAPDVPVHGLMLLGVAERRQLIEQWNATDQTYPPEPSLHQLFEAQVRRTPDSVAVVHAGRSLTYAELNGWANRLARHLRGLGVGADGLTGICVERSLEMVAGVLGVLKAGGAYVPLDPTYPPERLAFMLADAAPVVLLTQPHVLDRLPLAQSVCQVVLLDSGPGALADMDVADLAHDVQGEHLAYVIYTSGSTGRPKGAQIHHRGLLNLINWFNGQFGITSSDRVLLASSFSFDLTQKNIFSPLIAGGQLHIPAEVYAPAETLAYIREHGITFLNCAPSAFYPLLACHTEQTPLTLQQVFLGGEPVQTRLLQQAFGRSEQAPIFHNTYGPTEASDVVSFCTWRVSDGGIGIPIGRPINNTRLYILDAWRQPVPAGVAGELYVGGDGVGRGYLNRPELTAEKFLPDTFSRRAGTRMYRTGDLARHLADGNIEYLGRIDQQVKIRGFRVEPGEIEAALTALPDVLEAAVTVREDAPGDRRLTGYVVVRAGALDVTVKALRTGLQRTLPDHMVPSHFVLLERLPLSPNGKLDRNALPAPSASVSAAEYAAPATATEAALARIWSEVLKVGRVGTGDNFFELGGHSLLVVEMLWAMEQAGLRGDVRAVYSAATLADLAVMVDAATLAQVPVFTAPPGRIPDACPRITPDMLPLVELSQTEIDLIVATVPGGAANVQDIYPLAPAQEGMYFHHLMHREDDPYIRPTLLAINSEAQFDALVAVLRRLVERHDVLRTAILSDQLREPVQVVYRQACLLVERVEIGANADAREELMIHFGRPMNLASAPVFQVWAARDPRTAQVYVLFRMHHLIGDATSSMLMQMEIQTCLDGRAAQLAPPVPYREFVAQALHHARQNDAEVFFRARLADITEPTAPFKLLNVHGNGEDIAEASETLDSALADSIRAAAKRSKLSPAILFHAAYALAIGACSGRDDVVFGTVMSGRLQGTAGARDMLGMFINTLPLRLTLGGMDVQGLIRQTAAALSELLAFEQAPLALAQRSSGLQKNVPLFSAILNYRNAAQPAGVDDAVAAVAVHGNNVALLAARERTNYPMTMSIDDLGDAFIMEALVHRSVAPARMLAYMKEGLAAIVQALDCQPEQAVAVILVLPLQERQQLVVELNQTCYLSPDHNATMHALFEAQVARTPEVVALRFNNQALTYAVLNARANRLAHFLRAQGVGADTRVGLCIERGIDMVVGLLGILKAGGAYVPLDPDYPPERLAYMLKDAQAAVLLTQQATNGLLPATVPVFCLDTEWGSLAGESDHNPAPLSESESLAYVIYTSGSTGKPKGVAVEHRGVVNRLLWGQKEYQLTAADRVLQKTPFSFDVSVWEFFWPIIAGATLVIAKPGGHQAPDYLAELIDTEGITTLHFVPPMLEAFLAATKMGRCATLRQVMCSGQALPPELAQRFFMAFPHVRLYNLYGPTEASIEVSHFSCCPADIRVPIGRPIWNTQLYVLDTSLRPAPMGVAGELHIGGVGLARGYLNLPALTAEKFIADPFSSRSGARLYKTGDLARILDDGNIEYLGRIDDQVKIRGFRIELGEIENRLLEHDAVGSTVVQACAVGGGERQLVAYVVVSGHAASMERSAMTVTLRRHLSSLLPEHMVPALYVPLPALPMLANGKIDRKALPQPDAVLVEREYVASRTPAEATLVAIWQEVLQVQQVGIHDNYFELGGDSIMSLRLFARMRQAGMSAEPRLLFRHQTIAELAPMLDAVTYVAPRQHASVGEQVLIPIQRAFLAGSPIDQHHYNQSLLLRIPDELEPDFVDGFVKLLYQRHDVLRLQVTSTGAMYVPLTTKMVGRVAKHYDLTGLDGASWTSELARIGQELKASLMPEHADVWRVALIDGAPKQRRLLVTFHHLVIDGVSWRILLHDLVRAYRQWQDGDAMTPSPKSSSFQQWGVWLQQQARALTPSEKDYWLGQAVQAVPAFSTTSAPVPGQHLVTLVLTAAETGILVTSAHRVFGSQINELLLAALYVALRKWNGQDAFRLALEGHGREAGASQLDLSQTLGWFTTLYPVVLSTAPEDSWQAVVKTIQKQLRAIPGNGLGFGLLQQLSDDAMARAALQTYPADILFNYLGQFDQALPEGGLFSATREFAGDDISSRRSPSYALEMNGMVADHVLEWSMSCDTERIDVHGLERLACHLGEELRTLVDYCGRQVHHVPLVNPTINFLHFNQGWDGWFNTATHFEWDEGKGNIVAMEQALRALVSSHEALRYQIRKGTASLAYVVLPPPGPAPLLLVEDLSDESGAAFEHRFVKRCEHWHASMVLGDERHLFRFVLFRCPPGQGHRLVLIFHHMVVDGESIAIIRTQLSMLYEQIVRGTMEEIPVQRGFDDWLREHAALMDGRKDDELAFWRALDWNRVAKLHTASRSPVPEQEGAASLHLGEAEVSGLYRLKGSDGKSLIQDAINLALLAALQPLLEGDIVLLETVANNRKVPQLKTDTGGIIGNLTMNSVIPLHMPLVGAALDLQALESIRRQRVEVPSEGRGLVYWRYSGIELHDIEYRPLVGLNLVLSDKTSSEDNVPDWVKLGLPFMRDESNHNIHAVYFVVTVFSNALNVHAYPSPWLKTGIAASLCKRMGEGLREIAQRGLQS